MQETLPALLLAVSVVFPSSSASRAMEILQFFYENDSQVLETKRIHGGGHAVEWEGDSMAAAISAHRSAVVWWLHHHFPDAEFDLKAAMASALKTGEIMVVHWLVWNGAEWPDHLGGDICVHEVAGQGRLDALQWMDQNEKLEGANDEEGQLMELGGEGSLLIHPAAINGHLEIAKCLRTKVKIPTSALGREHEVEFQRNQIVVLNEQLCIKAAHVMGTTMTEAAKTGYLDVMQWLDTESGKDPYIDVSTTATSSRPPSYGITSCMFCNGSGPMVLRAV
ncbi:hypothetical protein ON010_g3023 [Phytophthora cinnamomi]|nr:hypothetical protein ON010_g3023 [Phytophthora cinnamomi]